MQFVSEEEIEMLSKMSGVEILDAIKGIPFEEKSRIPDDSGVYVLTRLDWEQYIGSCYSIIIRIRHHHIKPIETIDVYLTNNIESDYLKLEQWFIHEISIAMKNIWTL